ARQDRSRALRPRSAGTLFGGTAHRSAYCPRLGPPVAPAKSGTKTSELRAALGSASRRRHRTHQTKAPVGTMSASRFNLIGSRRPFGRPPLHSTGRAIPHGDRKSSRIGQKTSDRELAPARRRYRRSARSGEAPLQCTPKKRQKSGWGSCFGNFLANFLIAGA